MKSPRSDTVAKLFLEGKSIGEIAFQLVCRPDVIESALRRAFNAADRPRGRR